MHHSIFNIDSNENKFRRQHDIAFQLAHDRRLDEAVSFAIDIFITN